MIPNIGPLEIAIVLAVLLVVFGPRKLPELGRSAGQTITSFRESISGHSRTGAEDDPGGGVSEPEPLDAVTPASKP